MRPVFHIIHRDTPRGQLRQLALLRRPGEQIIALAPPPRNLACRPDRTVHVPFGLASLAGHAIARHAGGEAIFHAWSLAAAPAARAAARVGGGQCVVSLPGPPLGKETKLLPWTLAEMDAHAILPTNAARDAMLAKGLRPNRLSVLPPPVGPACDLPDAGHRVRAALGVPSDAMLIVTPSEMVRHAGHTWASWAFAICRHAGLQARLVFPGTGPEERHVRYFAGTTGFLDEILFPGESIPRADLLAAADIVMLLADWDRDLQSHAEAMAAGAAVLAADTPDVAEFCTNEVNALLVEPGQPRSASAGLLRITQDEALRQRLVEGGKRLVAERCRLEQVRADLDGIYEAVS